jgi:transposase
MEKKDARSLSSTVQERLRYEAISQVLTGKTQVQVAKQLGVTRQAVGRWMKAYSRNLDFRALNANPRGRPKGRSLLPPGEVAQLVRTLIAHMPDELHLPHYLWSRDAIGELINKRYGIKLSRWTISRYLAFWGILAKRPVVHRFEEISTQTKLWIQAEYLKIRKQARREKAKVYWVDDQIISFDYIYDRSFGYEGHAPSIKIEESGECFGCYMMSAMTEQRQLYFMPYKYWYRKNFFLEFLQRLVSRNKTKMFVVARQDLDFIWIKRKARRWLEANSKQIHLFFFPI